MKKIFFVMFLVLFLAGCSGEFGGSFELIHNDTTGLTPEDPDDPEEPNTYDSKFLHIRKGELIELDDQEIIFRRSSSEDSIVLDVDGELEVLNIGDYVSINENSFLIFLGVNAENTDRDFVLLYEGESISSFGNNIHLERIGEISVRVGVNGVIRVINSDSFESFDWVDVYATIIDENALDEIYTNYGIEVYNQERNHEQQVYLEIENFGFEEEIILEEGDVYVFGGQEVELVRTSDSAARIRVGDETRTVSLNDFETFDYVDVFLNRLFFLEPGHQDNSVEIVLERPKFDGGSFKNGLFYFITGEDIVLDTNYYAPRLPETCTVDPSFNCNFFTAWRAFDVDGSESGAFNLVLVNNVDQFIEEVYVTRVVVSGQDIGASCVLTDEDSLPIGFEDRLSIYCEDMDSSFWVSEGERESFQITFDYKVSGRELLRTTSVDIRSTIN